MKLAFLVNEVATEVDEYTTTRLALAAARGGHEVWYLGLGDLHYSADELMAASGYRARYEPDDDLTGFLERATESPERVVLDQLDALFLRNDSVDDLHDRPWAVDAGIEFGRIAAQRGMLVVNDPEGLARAASKLYLEEFPESIRPKALISRDVEEIAGFVQAIGATVLKPLYGAKGRNVFMIEGETEGNLPQMIEAIREDGYVVAQEMVDGASDGDIRLFLLDGRPLEIDGTYAAFRRVPRGQDQRANVSTGAKPEAVKIGDRELELAAAMCERLRDDGMFLVGLDIIGDKVIEINVESPGGLQAVEHFTGIDFAPVVIDALEARLRA